MMGSLHLLLHFPICRELELQAGFHRYFHVRLSGSGHDRAADAAHESPNAGACSPARDPSDCAVAVR